ncbi:hypothetical protein MNR02_18340 (plasmid) [Shinella sp. H4-D48]|uniref:hypothetical protein n=1 Tax=Shinella sp. H4-D48 TaxID=2925841 RepID=UPI001F536FE6|nr:hypothetical protein [Shinella sp. H4-D48]UNK40471.1 hypothetical protein MNR02_18340 [Shinella sp. H4-D48]
MTLVLTCLLCLTVAMLLLWGMLAPARIYQLPFLVGVMAGSFLLPQLPGLMDDRFLPRGAYDRMVAFTILCLVAAWLGWISTRKPVAFLRGNFGERRLLIIAAALSVIGAYFYFKLSRLPGDMVVGVQMSGVPVIYLFVARLMTYGLAIGALCLARRTSLFALSIVVFDLVFYLDRIVVTGKRAETVELFAIFAVAFWFHRGWLAPRTIILAGVLVGTFLMNSMGDYRAITRENSSPIWQDISQIDVTANFRATLKEGGLEVRNAILRIDHAADSLEFDYGKFHWNRLVFNYVPSQIVGEAAKRSLMLRTPAMARDYNALTGTTETGMADAFQSFWYFGALKFFLIAYLLARLWASAKEGQAAGQIVYMLSVVPAMHVVSHQTDWVIMAWVHMVLFLVPSLALAAVPARRDPGAHPDPFASRRLVHS